MVFDEPPLWFLANQSVAQTPTSPRPTRAVAFVWPHCYIDAVLLQSNVVDVLDSSIWMRLAPLWSSFCQEGAFAYPWCSILSVDSSHRFYDWLVRWFDSKRSCIKRSLMKQPRRMHKKKTNESNVWQLDNPPRLDCLPCLYWLWEHSMLLSRH